MQSGLYFSICQCSLCVWCVCELGGQARADVPDIIAMTFDTMQYGRGLVLVHLRYLWFMYLSQFSKDYSKSSEYDVIHSTGTHVLTILLPILEQMR